MEEKGLTPAQKQLLSPNVSMETFLEEREKLNIQSPLSRGRRISSVQATPTRRSVSRRPTDSSASPMFRSLSQSQMGHSVKPLTLESASVSPSMAPKHFTNQDKKEESAQTRQDIIDELTHRTVSLQFRRFELLVEYRNLQNSGHTPRGMYVIPSLESLYVWYGVFFISGGFYHNAIFKFILHLPHSYPDQAPTCRFLTRDVFHPLCAASGAFAFASLLPDGQWRPYRDYICHILHVIRDVMFEPGLMKISQNAAVNKEAFRIWNEDRNLFAAMAQKTARLSMQDDVVFDTLVPSNPIRMTPLSNGKAEALYTQIMEQGRIVPEVLVGFEEERNTAVPNDDLAARWSRFILG